jgi:ATP-dependent DNA helicase RecG
MNLDDFERLLKSRENEHLEFKEARNGFDFGKLAEYCAALANEGGGLLILGVADKYPRRVVGSKACPEPEHTASQLTEVFKLKIGITEVPHPDGRAVVCRIPSHHIGVPVSYKGKYLMRAGESLVPMTPDRLRQIFDQAVPDFSAECCAGATVADLEPNAVDVLRSLWYAKTHNDAFLHIPSGQLLSDAELVVNGQVTFAALILLGKEQSLSRFLGQAEVVFEYRSSEAAGAAQLRVEYRKGYLLYHEDLWRQIDLRNDTQHFHDGLFVRDIRTFNGVAIREAIQNAVAHRDYHHPASTFVRQFGRRIEVISPGGLPQGVTLENILSQQNPRNRRIAETLAKCGLVERAGQGVDLMFQESIKESKAVPDFARTDDSRVYLTLHGTVQNPKFIKYLEQLGQQTLASFSAVDFIILDLISRDENIPGDLKNRLQRLRDLGAVEVVGRGRGTRYILSRQYYTFAGTRGTYTRKRGLDRDTNKELLLKHIKDNRRSGCQLSELTDVLPSLSAGQVKTLLKELKAEAKIICQGRTRSGRWYPI